MTTPVGRLTVEQLREELESLHLSPKGNKDTLKHRLQEGRRRKGASNNKPGKQAAAPAEQEATMADKEYTGRSSSLSSSSAATTATATTKVPTGTVKRKRYDYYCVIDFEATCELGKSFQYDNEIIEFPAVLLDGTTMAEVDAEFHAYVKPVLNPTLTAFCTELTGITQQKVDASDTFPVVLERFEAWMAEHGLWPESPTSKSVAFITDGPWDFRDFVHKQCGISDIKRPAYFNKWINLRHLFKHHFGPNVKTNLDSMLTKLDLVFEGRPHSGIDDTRNIARVAQALMRLGVDMKLNDKFKTSTPKYVIGQPESTHKAAGAVVEDE